MFRLINNFKYFFYFYIFILNCFHIFVTVLLIIIKNWLLLAIKTDVKAINLIFYRLHINF